jgi:predicted ATPase/DNA-binding SARP family transcriptional activator
MTLRIQTLGGLEITYDGQPLSGLKTRKAQALLVYLACQPDKRFSREFLQGLLWGESDKKRAAASLRQVLSGLGKGLPDGMLVLDGLEVAFSGADDSWLDLTELDEQPERYAGEFLNGFVVNAAPLWEEWLYSERERIRLAVLENLLGRGEAAATDDPAAAIPFYQQALLLEPWRESSHRELMRLYWRTGDRAAALRQYDECCRLLALDLDVEPSPESVELYERIERGDDPLLGNLPPLGSLTPFVGRRAELARLDDLLQESRLVTVAGAGGMGKSRLALEAARRRQNHYPDGVWFVALDSLSEADLIAPTIADVVGLRFSGSAPPAEQLLAFLRRKRLLLLLDNYEQLLPSTDLISQLLTRCPDVALLISSRQRLNLRSEQLLPLAGLAQAAGTDAQQPSDALDFFISAARRVQPTFDASSQPGPLLRICQLLEGMPLGLELAAGWLRLLTLPQIIEEIERSTAFLSAGHSDAPDRQRSLEAVFASSWAQLNREEQASLARLPVFVGGFDLAAWRQVVGTPVHRLLALAEKSLVQRGEGERFRLHERLRQFLAEAHGDPGAAKPHSRYYLARLAGYETQLSRGKVRQQQEIARILQPDMENIRAAWLWAIARRDWSSVEQAAQALFALYYQVLNRYDELSDLLRRGIDALSALVEEAPRLLGKLHIHQARVLTLAGQFDAALNAAIAALALGEELDDSSLHAAALARLGHAHQRMGNPAEGVRFCQEAVALAESHNLPLVLGDAHNVLGILALFESDYERARTHYRRALELRRVHDSEINAVIALNNLAAIVEDEVEKAASFAEVIAVSKAAGDRITWALSLSNRAQEIDSQGEYRRAYGMYREAMEILEPTGDEWLLGTYVLTNAATSARMLGYLDESNAFALRSLSICRRLQAPRGEGMAFVQLAINGMLRGELAAAKEHLQTALSIFAGIGEEWWGYMAARRNWAIYCYRAGEREEAEARFREALALDTAHNAAWGIITDSLWLALMAGERGETTTACTLLRAGVEKVQSTNTWELLPSLCVAYASFASLPVATALLAYARSHPLSSWPTRQWAGEMAARRGIAPTDPAVNLPLEAEALVEWLRGALA